MTTYLWKNATYLWISDCLWG